MFSKDFSNNHKVGEEDFTRNRVWGFAETFTCILLGVKRSLTVHVFEFLSDIGRFNNGSKQAFSRARKKLNPEGFIELTQDLAAQYYSDGDFKTYKGYRLLTIDGSDVRLPNTPAVIAKFGLCSGIPMASASIMYDPLNSIILDSVIAPYLEGNERKQAQCHLENSPKIEEIKSILLLDRGYPDTALIHTILVAGMDFVIRFVPDGFIKPLRGFNAPDAPLDSIIEIDTSKLSYALTLKLRKFKNIQPGILKLRVVRLKRDSVEDIFLLTSLLDSSEFPYECFEELYHFRWGIETRYGFLKNVLELENFASKTPQGVFQEFYATILCANINQLVVEAAEDEAFVEGKAENRQINKAVAVGLTRGQLLRALFSKDPMDIMLEKLVKQVARNTIRSEHHRSFSRKVKPPFKFHITRRRTV